MDKYVSIQSTEDWPVIGRHRVHRIGQVYEHTEYTGLTRNNKTLSAQDWQEITRYRVHRTGQK